MSVHITASLIKIKVVNWDSGTSEERKVSLLYTRLLSHEDVYTVSNRRPTLLQRPSHGDSNTHIYILIPEGFRILDLQLPLPLSLIFHSISRLFPRPFLVLLHQLPHLELQRRGLS